MSSEALPPIPPAHSRLLVTSADPVFRGQYMSEAASPRLCVEEAMSGAHALAKMGSNSFDTLILDRKLPDLIAQEVAEMAHRRFRMEMRIIDSSPDANFHADLEAKRGAGITHFAPWRQRYASRPQRASERIGPDDNSEEVPGPAEFHRERRNFASDESASGNGGKWAGDAASLSTGSNGRCTRYHRLDHGRKRNGQGIGGSRNS